jgi:uracil-DNA glycosylase
MPPSPALIAPAATAATATPDEPGTALDGLLAQIRACRHCEPTLPLGARPVLVAQAGARLLIAGQAPGTRVHASGIPWHDASGKRLRHWLGLTPERFYDARQVAIVPMGFCYPGKGSSGDLPPRPECRALWHDRLFQHLHGLRLRVVIGQYALAYHLGEQVGAGATLAEVVADWRRWQAQGCFVLPHPSPRNQGWLKRHPWFEAEVVPALREAVAAVLASPDDLDDPADLAEAAPDQAAG